MVIEQPILSSLVLTYFDDKLYTITCWKFCINFFHLCFFAAKPQKNKYRWFKVEGFGGGGGGR